ncbi:hypothetical protein ACN9U4_10920 [Staphylococcus caprae]|uniref:hypothetical protein n=1 Tax=Staphylococcus caprae TaxID=29380 RepID=UPI000E67CD54|nr:hypothetical protein [Staphylococcus caprae]RIM35412.1 hypothetical protein BU631_03650 [Staphylococcus caprae]
MIDNIILYFKNLPHLIGYCTQRIKQTWHWFVISFVISLVFILGLEGIFNLNHNTELVQVRWLFRVTALVVFGLIVFSIYLGYKYYRKDYMVMKSFHISAVTPLIVIALMTLVTMLVLGLIIAFLKPVNFDTSIFAFIYYSVMASIFIVIAAVMCGLLQFIVKRFHLLYLIASAICFFIVPILFIPKAHSTIIEHILMLNPVYYLVNGSAESVVFGAVSMNNIPYHIYFIFLLAIMCVINYALVRHIAFDKYDSQVTLGDNDTSKAIEHEDEDKKKDEHITGENGRHDGSVKGHTARNVNDNDGNL